MTSNGTLESCYSPAIYFDSDVLIDYWLAEGLSNVGASEDVQVPSDPYRDFVRELLKTDKRVGKMAEVREALILGTPRASAVVSPLALLEFIGWHAESAFKNIAADAVGFKAIQRKSQKEIGDYLSKFLNDRHSETLAGRRVRQGPSSASDMLAADTFVNQSFARGHGLQGVMLVDLRAFAITVADAWDVSEILAYLQMGAADILHLLAARHLGCRWIAAFDGDFARCRIHIGEGLGLTLLSSPDEILGVL